LAFDVDTILVTANDLKYTRAIQNRLAEWLNAPSEDFVRLVSSELLGNRRFTPAVKEQFTTITKRAFEQLLGERINDRLKGAMTPESVTVAESVTPVLRIEEIAPVETVITAEEIEGFHIIRAILRSVHIIRAILRSVVNSRRIFMRDAQSYCAILLDDNNRKPICRLRFNNAEKLSLGLFNDKKEEDRMTLESVDDIYNYSEQIKAAATAYLAVAEMKTT
jgi:predicted type IV restriction endonuclease